MHGSQWLYWMMCALITTLKASHRDLRILICWLIVKLISLVFSWKLCLHMHKWDVAFVLVTQQKSESHWKCAHLLRSELLGDWDSITAQRSNWDFLRISSISSACLIVQIANVKASGSDWKWVVNVEERRMLRHHNWQTVEKVEYQETLDIAEKHKLRTQS